MQTNGGDIMATMIPADIAEFKTEGEGRFYHFLNAVVTPCEQHIVSFLPDVDEKISDYCCSDYLQKATNSVKYCQ